MNHDQLTVTHLETDIILRPLSTIAMSLIALVCPFNVTGQRPVSEHHIFSIISAPHDKTTRPLGNHRHLYTAPTCSLNVL